NNSSLITTITRSLKENQRWKGELSGVSRLGEHFTVNVVVEKLVEILSHNNKYVVTFTDISRRKVLERRLRMLVDTDSLTGCWNRRRFDKDLNHYSNLAERYG
ncbi:GGDEF domain-containing protein, partial [Vibrio sp. F13]